MGRGGEVIAVEADSVNFLTCKKNFLLYNKITNRNIELINAAAWSHSNGIFFSSEGNMGSSAVDIVGFGRAESKFVKTVTLVDIVEQFKLKRVDFIKVDIEGAEVEVLKNSDFFKKFKPKVVIECHNVKIECHNVKGVNTDNICKKLMESYGYNCESKKQDGYPLPLLYCYP